MALSMNFSDNWVQQRISDPVNENRLEWRVEDQNGPPTIGPVHIVKNYHKASHVNLDRYL
jgi:hypothetical protein